MPNMEWYKLSKCERCVQDPEMCVNCSDNPVYANIPRYSLYMAYKPVCPRGFSDCVTDPAYIKFHYPDWYKNLYGDMTPEEAIHIEGGCWESYQNDLEMNYYCYDDEDK